MTAAVTPEEFVQEFVRLREQLTSGYMSAPNLYAGGALVARMGLTAAQRDIFAGVLDALLTDAFYTVLLALDGEATLGVHQVPYNLRDGSGNELSGHLEGPAYEAFHSVPDARPR